VIRTLAPAHALGSGPAEVHVSVGRALRLGAVRVRWPDGTAQDVLDLPVRRVLTIRQGSDAVGIRELGTSRLGTHAEEAARDEEPKLAAEPPPASLPRDPARPGGSLAAAVAEGAFVSWARDLLVRTIRPQGHAGKVATLTYFAGDADCRRQVRELTGLRHRFPGVSLVVVRTEGVAACETPHLTTIIRGDVRPPLLPALALFDATGHMVLLQLGLIDIQRLTKELEQLAR
jgi:hypothetical protein